jgi:hypothetical protein
MALQYNLSLLDGALQPDRTHLPTSLQFTV